MVIKVISLFLAGLFFANGIPHFVNGISGRQFHNPSLHRFVPNVPSPVFNVIWGLFSFGLALLFLTVAGIINDPLNGQVILFASGFVVASVGLSIFFYFRP